MADELTKLHRMVLTRAQLYRSSPDLMKMDGVVLKVEQGRLPSRVHYLTAAAEATLHDYDWEIQGTAMGEPYLVIKGRKA